MMLSVLSAYHVAPTLRVYYVIHVYCVYEYDNHAQYTKHAHRSYHLSKSCYVHYTYDLFEYALKMYGA